MSLKMFERGKNGEKEEEEKVYLLANFHNLRSSIVPYFSF